ncbi:MAG: DUF6624 domain-containing protein [Gemmatimonadota bacterium]
MDGGTWNQSLRPELLVRLARDQGVRDTFLVQLNSPAGVNPALIASMAAVDSVNLAWLKPLLLANGWPTREALQADGVEAVFLLVQHAGRDPAFQAAMLPLLDSAYRKGEVDGQSLALLTDRVAKAQGRRQVYGTQTTAHGSDFVIDPIADSETVDDRRAQLGLPPLAVYKHMLDSLLAHAGTR